MNLPERICRHQHPMEWTSPVPRTNACEPCIALAVAITPINQLQNQVMHIERTVPGPPVVVICANCGGRGVPRRRA